MTRNKNLHNAKAASNDEFYTLPQTVADEMWAYADYNANVFRGKTILLPCDDPEWSAFTKFFIARFDSWGIYRLISTSFNKKGGRGKLYSVTRDLRRKKTKWENVEITDLEGDGDFRSEEVTKLRDQADFIITNPPFSLFREFLKWILAAKKQFAVIANINAITYKEHHSLIENNEIWLGATGNFKDMVFRVPPGTPVKLADRAKAAKLGYPSKDGNVFTRLGNSCWFTNIPHAVRTTPLDLITMEENKLFNRRAKKSYQKYDNHDAIEVGAYSAIPCDYEGNMGVPITFLSKYCPKQFKIVGWRKGIDGKDLRIDGEDKYFRIIIKKR